MTEHIDSPLPSSHYRPSLFSSLLINSVFLLFQMTTSLYTHLYYPWPKSYQVWGKQDSKTLVQLIFLSYTQLLFSTQVRPVSFTVSDGHWAAPHEPVMLYAFIFPSSVCLLFHLKWTLFLKWHTYKKCTDLKCKLSWIFRKWVYPFNQRVGQARLLSAHMNHSS